MTSTTFRFFRYASGIFLVALALVSCKKQDNAPQKAVQGYGNISYFATTSSLVTKTLAVSKIDIENRVSTSVDSTVIVDWSAAFLYVTKIEFTGQNGNLLDSTITVGKNLNIFSTNALAGVIKLPAGSYKNVSVKIFCEKSEKSEMAFNLKGTFTDTSGGRDSVMVGSSYPFTANLSIANDLVVNPSDNYSATFQFDLTKVLTGITNKRLQTARTYTSSDNKITYVIWKGGSAEEPFFDQVISNWQTVASVVITRQ